MLETYISGAHIQVDQRQSHAYNSGSHCHSGGEFWWPAGYTTRPDLPVMPVQQ